jgi:hypothetical protein
MPTKKPSVTAYLDSALFERLVKYQKAKNLKTLSKAANLALKEFFEMLAVREEEEEKETLSNVKRELENIRSDFDRRISEVTEKLRRIEEQQNESED